MSPRRLHLLLQLAISVLWIFFSTAMLLLFNQYILMLLPLGARMILTFITYWALAAVPLIFTIKYRYCPFQTNHLCLQLLWGVGIGGAMSVVCTLLPHLLGLGRFLGGNMGFSKPWQFIYQFVYFVAAVGLVEEFLFRGFLYHRVRLLFHREWVAILITSVLFGLFHFGYGDILQILSTGLIGAFFCLCRQRLRYCTLLSLVIAHGVYDWLICFWAWFFR